MQALAIATEPVAAPASDSALTAPLLERHGSVLERHSSASSLTDMLVIPTTPVGGVLPTALDVNVPQPLKCWPTCPPWADLCLRMMLPVLVLCVGLGFSIAALSVAFTNLGNA